MTPRWSREKPTVQGWYWMRRLDVPGKPYGMCEVRILPFGSNEIYTEIRVVDYWESLNAFMRDTKCQWAGPLVPPAEGEEEG